MNPTPPPSNRDLPGNNASKEITEPPAKRTRSSTQISLVSLHFETDKTTNQRRCKHCGTIYQPLTSISNLLLHLRKKHREKMHVNFDENLSETDDTPEGQRENLKVDSNGKSSEIEDVSEEEEEEDNQLRNLFHKMVDETPPYILHEIIDIIPSSELLNIHKSLGGCLEEIEKDLIRQKEQIHKLRKKLDQLS